MSQMKRLRLAHPMPSASRGLSKPSWEQLNSQALVQTISKFRWLLLGQGVDGGVIDALDGVALPDRQLYIHGGNLTFTTDAIPVSNPENVEVSVDSSSLPKLSSWFGEHGFHRHHRASKRRRRHDIP